MPAVLSSKLRQSGAIRATGTRIGGGKLAGMRMGTWAAGVHGCAVGAALWLCAGSGMADGVPAATRLGVVERADGLRLAIDVTPAPAFTLYTLTDPDRLVIDFPALDWQIGDVPQLPGIKSVRQGVVRSDRARLVLELAEPLGVVRAFTEPGRAAGPARLLVDLAPVSRAAFNARSGPPEKARRPSAPQADRRPDMAELVVAVDPGHGGIDPGARVGDLVEKQLVLRFATLLVAAIEARPGFRAYLTRDADVFVPLARRVGRAHAAGAQLLVSIHADVLAAGHARGVSAYTLSDEATDAAAEALAARENRSDVLAGADLGGEADDLTRLLVDLAQRGTQDELAKLAQSVLDSVARHSEVLRTRPLRQAGFRVLQAPDLPSILLELGFMDDAEDHRRLSDPAWLARTAEAVAQGIVGWRAAASPGFVAPRDSAARALEQ